MTWKTATTEEIGEYYHSEFDDRFSQIPSFITESEPKEIAAAFQKPFPVRGEKIPPRDFIRREAFTGQGSLTNWTGENGIRQFIKNPPGNDPLSGRRELAAPEVVDEPSAPEAVYVSADFHDRNWLLLVDIDAKDVALERGERELDTDTDEMTGKETKTQAGILSADPSGHPYAFEDIDRALEYGFEVQEYYRDSLGTSDTIVVYSGQGCHVYLYDPDSYYRYKETGRRYIAYDLMENRNIPIDKPVTTDESRVIRLPYTLHADVSRVVTPIYDADFDYREKATPKFLKQPQEQS